MNIRDLDYMEDLSANTSHVCGGQTEVLFNKVLNSSATNAANFQVNVDILKNVEKNTNIFQDVDLTGNSAILFVDTEAVGPATEVEVDASILTIANELSSISVFAESAAFDPGNGGGGGGGVG